MRNADANVIKIKHEVLEEVARLAFDGELEEHKIGRASCRERV